MLVLRKRARICHLARPIGGTHTVRFITIRDQQVPRWAVRSFARRLFSPALQLYFSRVRMVMEIFSRPLRDQAPIPCYYTPVGDV